MLTIETNLDFSDMANILRERFEGITNKQFILETLNYHFYDFPLLTKEEYRALRTEFNV